MERKWLIQNFNKYYPKTKRTPKHQTVKKEHSYLYDNIIKRFNGYRSFLRAAKRKMPPTSAKERAFIKYSSNVSRRYFENEWSSLEERAFWALGVLGEEDRFIHNCPFPSPSGHMYKLDFFDIDRKIVIEVDGVYHTALPTQKEKDNEKDAYLEKFGIRVLRLDSNDFKDLRTIHAKISQFIMEKYEI